MGDFSKPKVTIDLEEYNSLLDGSSSIDPYKKLLGALITTINLQDGPTSSTKLLGLKDLISIVRDCGLELDFVRHKDQIEVRGIKYLNY